MTQSAPHNAKLRKLASMIPAFFVGLLKRSSSIDLPLAPSAACFSAIKRFMALRRSRNTSTDSFVISIDKIDEKLIRFFLSSSFQNYVYFKMKTIFFFSNIPSSTFGFADIFACDFISMTDVFKELLLFLHSFLVKSKFCTP